MHIPFCHHLLIHTYRVLVNVFVTHCTMLCVVMALQVHNVHTDSQSVQWLLIVLPAHMAIKPLCVCLVTCLCSPILPIIVTTHSACGCAEAVVIHSLAHDQCRPCGIVLGPLHFPHQLEVGRDGGAAVTWPLQVVKRHHIEVVGIVLYRREGGGCH